MSFEQEYQELGEQGMVQKYGARFQSQDVVPEIDNTPMFTADEGAAMAISRSRSDEYPHRIEEAQAVLDEFDSGSRTVGEKELAQLQAAVARLMLAEASGEDDAQITLLSADVRNAGNAWRIESGVSLNR